MTRLDNSTLGTPMTLRLAPRALKAARIREAITTSVVVALMIGGAVLLHGIGAWSVTLYALAAVAVIWGVMNIALVEGIYHRNYSYALGEHSLVVEHGVMVRVRSAVPYAQVLVVERRESPIARACGIVVARLRLPGEHIDIPGLTEPSFIHLDSYFRRLGEDEAEGQRENRESGDAASAV